MGLEMKTVVNVDNQKHLGRLHLDSQELSFSSPTLKWSHKVGPNVSLKQAGGQLRIDGPMGIVTIEIGRDIDRWVDKILNPPSRLTKLGFKDRDCLWMSRGFSKEFREELKLAKITTTRSLERCSAAMHMVKNEDQLAAAAELLQGLPVGINAWLVWPRKLSRRARV